MLLTFASPEQRRARATAHPVRYRLTRFSTLLIYMVVSVGLLVPVVLGNPWPALVYFGCGCCLHLFANWRRFELTNKFFYFTVVSGAAWIAFAPMALLDDWGMPYRYYGPLDILKDLT
jgi:hypothetical protein